MNRRLFAMIILASIANIGAAQDDAETKAVKLIEKAGGKVAREPKIKGNPVVGVDLSAKKVGDAELKDFAVLTQLQTLDLSFTPITDVGVKDLAKLGQLQSLDLRATKITDAGLK